MVSQISTWPVAWANLITIGLFIFLALVIWLVPRRKVLADAPDQKSWRDLRWWAVALIVLQLGIYTLFE